MQWGKGFPGWNVHVATKKKKNPLDHCSVWHCFSVPHPSNTLLLWDRVLSATHQTRRCFGTEYSAPPTKHAIALGQSNQPHPPNMPLLWDIVLNATHQILSLSTLPAPPLAAQRVSKLVGSTGRACARVYNSVELHDIIHKGTKNFFFTRFPV